MPSTIATFSSRPKTRSAFAPQADWLAIYSRHIDNVRTALDWAFSPDGDPQIGVALTVAVVPLWVQLSLLGECRERVERALASLGDDATTTARRGCDFPRHLAGR